MSSYIVITIVALVFSGLFSGAEIAFVTSDRVRAEIDVKKGGIISRIIDRFYDNSDFFISSILVGNNVMLVIYGIGAAALVTPYLEQFIDNEALLLAVQTVITTGVILITGEFLPKTMCRINPNSALKLFALPIFIFYLLFYPISQFTTWLSKLLMRVFGIKGDTPRLRTLSVDDLNDYLEETIDTMEEKRETVENEVKLFQNALEFSETHLRDCMIPRNEIVAVNIHTATRDSLVKLFTATGRSKIIVYDEEIDSVVGYLHVSELFDPKKDWHDCLKPVIFAPETFLANKMMRRMLNEKRSLAIIVDEFGGTAGLVTLEDLVEEIFGDIQDEHDKSGLTMRQTAPGVYEFSGRCEITTINDQFHIDIPENDDYQTLAGYILTSTGTIPDTGATVELGNLKFDILKKSANRLELIRVIVLDTPSDSTNEKALQ